MEYGKIRIETNDSLQCKFWKIYLDGVEITNYLRSIKINVDARTQIPEIVLEVIGKLEIPAEIMGAVKAYITTRTADGKVVEDE